MKKILLVEPDQDQQLIALEQFGRDYEILVESDWRSAKAYFHAGGKHGRPHYRNFNSVDVVLTALFMKEQEGVPFAKSCPLGLPLALLALRSGVPRVAVAANGKIADVFSAYFHLDRWVLNNQLFFYIGSTCPNMSEAAHEVPGLKQLQRIKNWKKILETTQRVGNALA